MRKALSKRTRFEIFKRDNFKCAYCGATPMSAVLHVDHIDPVANGGSNDPSNLVTACQGCNLGKGARALGGKLPAMESPECIADHAEQIAAYLMAQKERAAVVDSAVEFFHDQWAARLGSEPVESFAPAVPALIRDWPLERLFEAIDITARRFSTLGNRHVRYEDRIDMAKYFYGILRKWRQERP